MRKDFEFFKETYKKRRHGKYHILSEILFNWYRKCRISNIYLDGALLQEEAMGIKKRWDKEELNDFIASNGWLESWKKACCVREKSLFGESDDVSTTTIEALIERLAESCQGYETQNILNLKEFGLFLKALPEKRLAKKKK